MGRHRPGLVSLLPALLALAMLSFASVQSVLMRTAMPEGDGIATAAAAAPATAMPMPPGMDMAGMDMPGMDKPGMAAPERGGRDAGHRVHHAACPYCAAAAHLPIVERVVVPRRTVSVSFAAFRIAAGSGPRGPPFLSVRARGPPA